MDLHLGDGHFPSGAWQSSSFNDFLSWYAPELLPRRPLQGSPIAGELSHGTTIVAAVHERGVVLAGDRRAIAGNMIAKRDVDKVFRSDEFSAVASAGPLGRGLDFASLFQVELEHYEKMEGRPLTLMGKAHRLAALIRGN